MEWKLFFGDGNDSSSFEKGKTLFHVSLPSTKQKIPVLGPVLGTANGPALPSAWELNSHVQKSQSMLESSSAKTAEAQGGLHAPPFQS